MVEIVTRKWISRWFCEINSSAKGQRKTFAHQRLLSNVTEYLCNCLFTKMVGDPLHSTIYILSYHLPLAGHFKSCNNNKVYRRLFVEDIFIVADQLSVDSDP